MNSCLNCGKELHHIEGRRPKKYCDNNCRQKYFQKTTKGKEPKYVQYKTFKELKEKFDELSKGIKYGTDKNNLNPTHLAVPKNDYITVKYVPVTPESYDGKKIDKLDFDEIGQYEQQEEPIFKGYAYYEAKAKKVEFDDAEALIIEIMASCLKSWQMNMLKTMINKKFDF